MRILFGLMIAASLLAQALPPYGYYFDNEGNLLPWHLETKEDKRLVVVTVSRQPLEALRAVTGKTPAGTALYSVLACADSSGPAKLASGSLQQAIEHRGIPIADQRLGQATAERARNSGKLAFIGGVFLEVAELGGVSVPALQGAGVIRGSPWISGGMAATGFVANRIRRLRESRKVPIEQFGPWLQNWPGSEISAGECWPRLFFFGGYDKSIPGTLSFTVMN